MPVTHGLGMHRHLREQGCLLFFFFFVAELSLKFVHVFGLQMKLVGAIPYCETLNGWQRQWD